MDHNSPTFQQDNQNHNLYTPPIMPYELNTQEIMQTIWSTSELIKRTKLYVENIPNKTDFYQSTISESRRTNQDYINREKYYSVGRLDSSHRKNETCNDSAKFQELSWKSPERFQKSPTPVQKLTDFEFQIDFLDINSGKKTIDQTYKTHETYRKPKNLSLIEQIQQNQSHVNETDSDNIQTFRPTGWKSPKNNSKPIELKSPKNISIFDTSNYVPKDIVSTGSKTPRTKTFQVYSSYSEEHHSSQPKRRIPETFETQQNKNVLTILKPDQQINQPKYEPIRYFKKQIGAQRQAQSNIEKVQKAKQKRQQRTKAISSILESHRTNSKPFEQTSKFDHDQKIQTEGKINLRSVNSMTEPRSGKSNQKIRKDQPQTQKKSGKWAKKAAPVNPFESIEEEYESNNKLQKSPFKMTKTYSKTHKNSLSPKNSYQSSEKKEVSESVTPKHKNASNYFSAKRSNSPEIKEYQSIQINMQNSFEKSPIQRQNLFQQGQLKAKSKKKHGITVLLNSSSPKNSIKIQQTRYDSAINPFEMTVSQQDNQIPGKKRYIQISIQNSNNPFEPNQRKTNYIQTPTQKSEFHQKVNVSITPANKNSQKSSLADRINLQLNRLEVLNHVDNQIYMRESGKSKERSPRKSLKTDSSRKFQRTESQNLEKQKSEKNLSQDKIPMDPEFKRYPLQSANRQKLKINQINNLTIYPSSLEKYKSENNASRQESHKKQTIETFNNTFSFTPEKKKPNEINVPKSHIIKLENSMESLMSNSQEKSISTKRKKIFDSREKSNKKYKMPQTLFINPLRAKELYKKQFDNHNKTLEAKLYNFLVQEDSVGRRPTEKKRKFSPTKKIRRTSNSKLSKIFDSYAGSTQKSERGSPRRLQNVKALFKYTPAKENERSNLLKSVQNFQQSVRVDSLDKKSVKNSIEKSPKSRNYLSDEKLNQEQIRHQIKRIKEYEFVEKYMTNFELQKLMRGYIHKHIPARKWSLLVIDEVYKRIRSQKQKSQIYGMVN